MLDQVARKLHSVFSLEKKVVPIHLPATGRVFFDHSTCSLHDELEWIGLRLDEHESELSSENDGPTRGDCCRVYGFALGQNGPICLRCRSPNPSSPREREHKAVRGRLVGVAHKEAGDLGALAISLPRYQHDWVR